MQSILYHKTCFTWLYIKIIDIWRTFFTVIPLKGVFLNVGRGCNLAFVKRNNEPSHELNSYVYVC